MEIESTNHQDVAEPDQVASGMAGTGQENRNTTGIAEIPDAARQKNPCRKDRETIGLGILYNGPMHAGTLPDTFHGTVVHEPAEDPREMCGDRIFECYERQERIADRLNKKIRRLDERLSKIEERGRE
jgi:hypothetical protein